MTPRQNRRWALFFCGLAAVCAAAALAACGSSGGGSSTASKHGRSQPTGHTMEQTAPAAIDPKPQSFASADLLRPSNAWRTSSTQRFTEVDAGALAHDSSIGALFIFRHEYARARQEVELLKVIGSGALRITKAPEGAKVEASAQENGEIAFVGSRGVRGTLHLENDTISLSPPATTGGNG